MRVTILGCGTSGGVPSITGYWGACDPDEPKNTRTRASVLVEAAGQTILIDTSPDLRVQCLRSAVSRVDAVLYTHDHADHVHGIDDLRFLSVAMGAKIPVFADGETLATLRARFPYIFRQVRHYPAICRAREISGPFSVGAVRVLPFEQRHGAGLSLGFRIGDFAYSTDVNGLSETAFDVLDGVKLWVVDALRYAPHPTHAHLDMTLDWINRVRPERAVLTHMGWEMDYTTLKSRLPQGVEPGFDGLCFDL